MINDGEIYVTRTSVDVVSISFRKNDSSIHLGDFDLSKNGPGNTQSFELLMGYRDLTGGELSELIWRTK